MTKDPNNYPEPQNPTPGEMMMFLHMCMCMVGRQLITRNWDILVWEGVPINEPRGEQYKKRWPS